MSGVICRKAGGTVCESHCLDCEYHKPLENVSGIVGKWCLYQEPERPWKTYLEGWTKDEMLMILARKTGRVCTMSAGTDEDGHYYVVDAATGEASRLCRIRLRDGVWQYGHYIDAPEAADEEKAK